MSIASIFQTTSALLNNAPAANAAAPQLPQAAQPAATAQAGPDDRFTPSQTNAASEAGLFQLQQPQLAAQPATSQPSEQTQTQAPATSSVTQSQAALQTLNSTLAGLGLTQSEIAAFDQYAGVLLQFDPNGLQDLQNQLNLLAVRFATAGGGSSATQSATAQPAASNENANAGALPSAAQTSPTNAAATTLPVASSLTSGGGSSLQLSAFSITLTTGPAAPQSAPQNATAPFAATPLQLQEASVTFSTPNGQTVQLHTANSSSTQQIAKTATA